MDLCSSQQQQPQQIIYVDENNNVIGIGSGQIPAVAATGGPVAAAPTAQLVQGDQGEGDDGFDKEALIDENPAYNYAVNVADDDEQLYQTHKQELSDNVRYRGYQT